MRFFVLCLSFLSFSLQGLLASPPERFGELEAAIDRSIKDSENRKSKKLLEHELWLIDEYLFELRALRAHLGELSSRSDWSDLFPGFEAHFSSLNCRFFFENADQEMLTEMNRLHSEIYGSQDQFELWKELKDLSQAFIKTLPANSVSQHQSYRVGELGTLAWAAEEFSLDIANLLFHHNSPTCTRPQNRAPKSLAELWLFDQTHRAPHEKYALLQEAWLALPVSDVLEDARRAFVDLQVFVDRLNVERPNLDLKGFSVLVSERLQGMKDIQLKISALQSDRRPDRLRLDFVAKVYDSRGRLREILFSLDSKDLEANTELHVSPDTLLGLMQKVEAFSLMRSHLRMSLEADQERLAFLDFYWGRQIGSPLIGLRPRPIYPPLGSQHSPELLSQVMDIGHFDFENISLSRKIFLEDLTHLQPVYDQIKIIDQRGSVLRRIPIIEADAEWRRRELVESLKLAGLQDDLRPLASELDSGIRLSAQLDIRIFSKTSTRASDFPEE